VLAVKKQTNLAMMLKTILPSLSISQSIRVAHPKSQRHTSNATVRETGQITSVTVFVPTSSTRKC